MELNKYYYSQFHNCYFLPISKHTGDFYKGVEIKINEFGNSEIIGRSRNFKESTFTEISKEQFTTETKNALDYFKFLFV